MSVRHLRGYIRPVTISPERKPLYLNSFERIVRYSNIPEKLFLSSFKLTDTDLKYVSDFSNQHEETINLYNRIVHMVFCKRIPFWVKHSYRQNSTCPKWTARRSLIWFGLNEVILTDHERETCETKPLDYWANRKN